MALCKTVPKPETKKEILTKANFRKLGHFSYEKKKLGWDDPASSKSSKTLFIICVNRITDVASASTTFDVRSRKPSSRCRKASRAAEAPSEEVAEVDSSAFRRATTGCRRWTPRRARSPQFRLRTTVTDLSPVWFPGRPISRIITAASRRWPAPQVSFRHK